MHQLISASAPARRSTPPPSGAGVWDARARSARLDRSSGTSAARGVVIDRFRTRFTTGGTGAEGGSLESWSDEELVRAARSEPGRAAEALDHLFRRHQRAVAAWCLRHSGRREEAADLAQEVFLRVHERLGQFRFESSFSTWLYLVTRSVVINRSIANRRRDASSIDDERFPEPVDPSPSVVEELDRAGRLEALRAAVAVALEPLEAKVLHLHFVDEMPLAAIDGLLGLENKSGSKAYIVSAKRKLARHFAASPRDGVDSGSVAP